MICSGECLFPIKSPPCCAHSGLLDSLSLCVSFRYGVWMTPIGAEDGFLDSAARDGSMRIAPRSLWRLRPLIEIGELDSLHKEPSAGLSTGELPTELRR
jgi:hypothetical protein